MQKAPGYLTPLHKACDKELVTLAEALLDAGADVNAVAEARAMESSSQISLFCRLCHQSQHLCPTSEVNDRGTLAYVLMRQDERLPLNCADAAAERRGVWGTGNTNKPTPTQSLLLSRYYRA